MAAIAERMAARIEGDFVVFLIGARINKPWKVHKWLPVAFAMPRMIKELKEQTGFLGVEPWGFGMMVQYWRSFEQSARQRAGRGEPSPDARLDSSAAE
jgi:hypothetical protein